MLRCNRCRDMVINAQGDGMGTTRAARTSESGAATALLDGYARATPRPDVIAHGGDRGAWDIAVGEAVRIEPREGLSLLPLLVGAAEWARLADGLCQRAELLELLLDDLYGSQRLTGNGLLPGALVCGSPHFLRPLVGMRPPGGKHLHLYAADLIRDAQGRWRVTADHTRTPAGLGRALANRLAVSRAMPELAEKLNIERLAPFFADLRAGIAHAAERSDPRIALLTPGRWNRDHAEHAQLARYLGMLLVEGEDLAVHDDRLYLLTIEGMKRVDALWRMVDPRLVDPLAFDSRSRIGVPGLIDAIQAGNLVIANAPGTGVLESPAFAAYLPKLAVRLTGEDLRLPSLDSHWCGDDEAAAACTDLAFEMIPAFGGTMLRALDRVARERLAMATMPALEQGQLVPRHFTMRVFLTRDAGDRWRIMPGGIVTLDNGLEADVAVLAEAPVAPVSLLTAPEAQRIRRNPGTLPARIADNMFWLGRYLERTEGVTTILSAGWGRNADGEGAALSGPLHAKLAAQLVASGAAAPSGNAFAQALDDRDQPGSAVTLYARAAAIGEDLRDRLPVEMTRLLRPTDVPAGRDARLGALETRLAAIAGMAAETMGRSAAWRFLDAGRRIERAVQVSRLTRAFGGGDAEGLNLLLRLTSNIIAYRQRYPAGVTVATAFDLILLDPTNPRGLAYQVAALKRHLERLPRLGDDGLPEAQQVAGDALAAQVAALQANRIDEATLLGIENGLLGLSEAIARRYFLRGDEPVRAGAMVLA
jgi:uncharacterized circularly permuted ATP-grasp superfamily protein/uncharacterized alpha-E superfamily protein